MVKSNTLSKKNQDCIEKFIQLFHFDPEKALRLLPRRVLRLLNVLIKQCLKFRINSPSQETIAHWMGVQCRETANRLIKMVCATNLIIKTYRHRTTCIYKLNLSLQNSVMAFRLRHLLPGIWLSYNLTLIAAAGADLQKNVTPLKVNLNNNIYIKSLANKQPKISNHSTKRIVGDISHQLQNGWNEPIKSIVRGEKVMEALISPVIESVSSLNLTLAGKIALMCFPDEAVLWADETIAKRKNILEPFVYFRNLCMRYCFEHKIAVDWSITPKLNNYHKVAEGSAFLEKNIINRKPLVPKARDYLTFKKETHKQEGSKPKQEWEQPEAKRYGYMRMRIPYNPKETQATANYRAMLRANNALIEDDEPLPHKGIWPLIPREETDKSYEEFLKSGKIPDNIFRAARFINHPVGKVIESDEPPGIDYSQYEEDYSDVVLEL